MKDFNNTGNSSVLYAITITLQPKLYKYKLEEQYDRTYLHVGKQLKALGTKVDLIAEITKHNCNLHYHGILKFYNFKPKTNLIIKFYDHFRMDPIIGFVNIRQMDDEQGWKDYITKEIYYTKESLDRMPIVINEISKFKLCNDYGHMKIDEYLCLDLVDEQ